eukprot:TRINITY_DN6101_c0_g1_i5.p2 TRINITY_DN6101_c0_g1~~TRINITY_DN6101_c0_g1_i5.p2  ORF type:complete len:140 (-),score=13.17 TRINITY_DN6101_c0_g1_i5:138-557(-)
MYLQHRRSNWSPSMFPPLAKNEVKSSLYGMSTLIILEAIYKEARRRFTAFKGSVLGERQSQARIKRNPLKDISQHVENTGSPLKTRFSLMPLLRKCQPPVVTKAQRNYPRSTKQVRRKRPDENKSKVNKSIYLCNWKIH